MHRVVLHDLLRSRATANEQHHQPEREEVVRRARLVELIVLGVQHILERIRRRVLWRAEERTAEANLGGRNEVAEAGVSELVQQNVRRL